MIVKLSPPDKLAKRPARLFLQPETEADEKTLELLAGKWPICGFSRDAATLKVVSAVVNLPESGESGGCPSLPDDNEPITMEWLRDVADELFPQRTHTLCSYGDKVFVYDWENGQWPINVMASQIDASRIRTRRDFRQLCWFVGVESFKGAW